MRQVPELDSAFAPLHFEFEYDQVRAFTIGTATCPEHGPVFRLIIPWEWEKMGVEALPGRLAQRHLEEEHG